jgi:protein SCO1/2
MKIAVCALLAAFAVQSVAAPASDSLYNLEIVLADQRGVEIGLVNAARGPALVSMFYGSCPHVCPMIVSSIQLIEKQLDAKQRAGLRVLMVSFEHERDTPVKLAELAARHRVDGTRWTFARASRGDVRLLAAALGIQYRKLPDGEYNHSTVIALLDREGRQVARSQRLGAPDPEFVAQVRQATSE